MDVRGLALGFPSKKKKQNNGAQIKKGLKNDIVQENGCHVTCRITVKNRPIKIQAKPESNLPGPVLHY